MPVRYGWPRLCPARRAFNLGGTTDAVCLSGDRNVPRRPGVPEAVRLSRPRRWKECRDHHNSAPLPSPEAEGVWFTSQRDECSRFNYKSTEGERVPIMRSLVILVVGLLLLVGCQTRSNRDQVGRSEVKVLRTEFGYTVTLNQQVTARIPKEGMKVVFALIFGGKETSVIGMAVPHTPDDGELDIHTDSELANLCDILSPEEAAKWVFCNDRFRLQRVLEDGSVSANCGNCNGTEENPDGMELIRDPEGCFCGG